MKRKFCLLFFAFFICVNSQAQKPEQLLNNWSEKSPIEKVYLQFDRDNYISGETAWFKAYLYSDYQPDTISTSLYAELADVTGKVLSRAIVPILMGTASGQFELPNSLSTGSYLIRAYSPTMLNNNPDFIYKRSIFIYGKKNKIVEVPEEKITRLEFFPEGGNFVNGFSNTIAFKATNENGLPATLKGNILNEKNEVLTTFSSYHDGMGLFELTPVTNQKYYAVVDGDLSSKKYYLPEQTDKGIALTVIPHPQGNFFELKQQKDDPALLVAYMIGQMQHHIVFKQEFKTSKEEIQGVINTQKLHSGILQITFFNKDDQPLAERLCFVNNKEYIQQGQLITDTINFNERGRNRFSIQLKDTVQGSFSVSITDYDYSLKPVREENIFSSLLLTSDLKGYIHNPAFYFSSDNDSVKIALDLVMMTNGWRRFKWAELSQKTILSNNDKDDAFITLRGKVTLRDRNKPFAENPLLLILITEDSTRSMQMISTGNEGNFRLDSMLFFGKSRIFFSDIRGKKSKYINVTMSGDSLARSFILPAPEWQLTNLMNSLKSGSQSRIAFDYDSLQEAKGLMLEGVTIKARKKNPIEALEEKYTSGFFSGDARKTFDLINTNEGDYFINIWDFLRAKGFSPDSRNMPSLSSMGNFSTDYFLDEIPADVEIIGFLRMSEIAMIKIFSTFPGSWGNGPGGAIAVYTKKGQDLMNSLISTGEVVSYNGYTIIKEFYAPDYSVVKPTKTQTDNRVTLDWRPNILVNNVNPKIPLTFYNNDRTKNFKIVVEGMTLDGKMLMIEKTIIRKGF